MPAAWQPKFRHFGGLTWLKSGQTDATLRVRARQLAKLGLVHAHSGGPALGHWGDAPPA